MGVNKLGNGNKDYSEGYAAGFAAGVAAWFAATGDVGHKLLNIGSHIPVPATDTSAADQRINDLHKVAGEGLGLSRQGSTLAEPSTAVVNNDTENTHPANTTEGLGLRHPGQKTVELSMTADKAEKENVYLAAVTDEELNLSYSRSTALETPMGAVKTNGEDANINVVTEEDLGHIAPGCFVRVGSGDASYWVEIGQIDGFMLSGVVHPELSTSLCVINHDSCEIARFSRDQITALGCDRYCWC